MQLPLNQSILHTKNERKKDKWSSLAWAIIIYVVSQIILGVLSALVIMLISSFTGNDVDTISQSSTFNTLFTLYGSLVVSALTIQVSIMLENRSNRSIGLSKAKGNKALKAIVYGGILGLVVSLMHALLGDVTYNFNSDINIVIFIVTVFGFIVKAFGDELLYRGYFMNALGVDGKITQALFVSSVVATIPILLSQDFTLMSLVNTFLFQLVLAIICYLADNIIVSSLFSAGWSIVNYSIFGSSLNGQLLNHSLFTYGIENASILSGGTLGIIGSLYTTLLLGIALFFLYNKLKHLDKTE